jgi:hypothetical protein
MNDNEQFDTSSNSQDEYEKLARWLLHVLTHSPQDTENVSTNEEDTGAYEVVTGDEYHPQFYRQLPDFIMALLRNDAKATVHYAPLLYHLAGCTVCHSAYLELYGALRYAVKSGEKAQSINYGSRSLPDGASVKLCQLLISQAEAVLRQARREHTDGEAQARSLLQWAMRVSAHITQSGMRARALRDLVRVATNTDTLHSTGTQELATHSYSPLIGASGTRHGKVLRKADTLMRSTGTPAEHAMIYLQSSHLEGGIIQREGILELHLHDLDENLRGRYLTISVPLGSLIEPVRWNGGDPRSIRSAEPVDKDGTLITPLGQTDLRLSNPDERNLLEVMFLLLEVRPAS